GVRRARLRAARADGTVRLRADVCRRGPRQTGAGGVREGGGALRRRTESDAGAGRQPQRAAGGEGGRGALRHRAARADAAKRTRRGRRGGAVAGLGGVAPDSWFLNGRQSATAAATGSPSGIAAGAAPMAVRSRCRIPSGSPRAAPANRPTEITTANSRPIPNPYRQREPLIADLLSSVPGPSTARLPV